MLPPRDPYMSSRGNRMTLILRDTINYVLLPFIVFLSKVISSFVKCCYLLYRTVQRIARYETFGPRLTHRKQPIYVASTFKKFKLKMQKIK